MPAEQVALTAINHNLKAVPVVDLSTGRLLGVVTPDKIRDILHYGRISDALAHAGTTNFEDPQNSLLSGTPLLHIRKRLPWLILGLLGGLLAASIVQGFEDALAAHVLIVAFIPLVVYLADAVGSQTEIIFVRAIALDPELSKFARFRRYFMREVIVSGTLATILGILVGGITSWWFGAPELVSLLFTAILATLMLAMVVALVIPFLATKLKYDPALTSGPVATVIRDVMTLWVYFLIVSLFT
jgi:magnesium transporter